MHLSQLESWVLAIVDRVRGGQPVEDARVELKADWPEPEKAARRIAGHANAARSESILWVIGLDETRGVIGVRASEVSEWHAQVNRHFDGLAPSLQDIAVPTGSVTLVALLIDTSRAPFVVRNPVAGQPGGGPVGREVPWREGTAVRSARREDLIRILTPAQYAPTIEVLDASCHPVNTKGTGSEQQSLQWNLEAELYIVPLTQDRVVIPFHRCKGDLSLAGPDLEVQAAGIRLWVPRESPFKHGAIFDRARELKKLSITIDNTDSELIIDGPGVALLRLVSETPQVDLSAVTGIHATIALRTAPADLTVSLTFDLVPSPVEGPRKSWKPRAVNRD